MDTLRGKIESILFVAGKPVSVRALARAAGAGETEVREALETMKSAYNHDASGIHLLSAGDEVQMATNPAHAAAIEGFIKDEAAGELTRAQLETLTVVAYRGPVTRPELEQIRGVNCALIIRNLLVRGLIEERETDGGILPSYTLSFETLRQLGIHDAEALPDYAALHAHAHVEQALAPEDDHV
jgi:segregation and condensation protein B